METISVAGHQVVISRRSRQRNMNLSVKPDGVIRLSCNKRMGIADIRDFVESCDDFIAKRRALLVELESRFPLREFLSGEKFLFKGERLVLDVIWTWHRRPGVEVGLSGLEMLAPLIATRDERAKALRQFYRREAKKYLAARVRFWSGLMGMQPTSLTVRGQRTLWGSCTSAGALSLNWKLMCCPLDVIDYVVVHELAHLREQNHSSRFWAVVSQFMPDYKIHRQWLKTNQQEISRQFATRD